MFTFCIPLSNTFMNLVGSRNLRTYDIWRQTSSNNASASYNAIQEKLPKRPQAQPPPVANVQSPELSNNGPTTWQEGMPIVFGGGAQQAKGGAKGGQTWDPSMGVQFGR